MSGFRPLYLLALLLLLQAAWAQDPKPSRVEATGMTATLKKGGALLTLPAPAVEKLGAEDAVSAGDKSVPLRYGVVMDTGALDVVPDGAIGTWSRDKAGLRWTLAVTATGAKNLAFAFSRFRLPHGASLTVRSVDGSQVLGPFTDADNPRDGAPLHTPLLATDAAVLEVRLPAAKSDGLQLTLASATWGYRDPQAAVRAKSGNCNVDSICPEGNAWRDQIASTVHYTFDSGSLGYVCTGTLLNTGDASQDASAPRLSTAYHCISTQAEADSMVFYWGYESPSCRVAGSADNGRPLDKGTYSRAVQYGGATLLAANRSTDFAVLQLKSAIPAAAQAYYSGWDRSDTTPSGSVGIHHPAGNEKRITLNTHALGTSANCIVTSTMARSHWVVGPYSLGTTEQGSSGSGLWNAANGRFIGVLSGGDASCTTPSGTDCYGRLNAAWEVASETGTTVRAALDRSGANPQVLPGRATCPAPGVSLASPAFSGTPVAGESLTFSARATGGAGGYTYRWDVDGDGEFERSGSDASVTVSFPGRRALNVQVEVVDAAGCTGFASHALDVAAAELELEAIGTPAQVCGNGNGGVDPGERFSVPVTLRNSGNAALATGARALFSPASNLATDVGPNAYGYAGSRSCAYGFVDIARGANAVAALTTSVADGNAYGPKDDARSTTIALGGDGFTLYGTRYTQAVMSTNGYVSFDPAETGGDFSISCSGEMDNGAKGPQLRPFHNDLVVGESALAGLRYRWFERCPRASATGVAQGCHVFQWTGMSYYDASSLVGDFEFEALAYATTGEVAYQYSIASPDQGALANIGLISVGGADPLNLACGDESAPAQAGSAVCIWSPQALAQVKPAFRLEHPSVALPAIAAGASATVDLPVAIRSDATCGASLNLDYIATAAEKNHSAKARNLAFGNVRATCGAVSSCPAQVPSIDTRDGNYYNPQRSGNGFNSYVFGGLWYTADASHLPTWYSLTGSYEDNLLTAPLLRVVNTVGPSTPEPQVVRSSVGTGRIARIDGTHAMFAWRFDDGRTGAELLTLTSAGVPRAGADHTQHWYPPSQSGWGLDVESLALGGQDKDIALVYLYDGNGLPRWVMGEGALASYRPHCPGCPRYDDWSTTAMPAGTMNLRFGADGQAAIDTAISLPAPLQGAWTRQNVSLIRIGEVRP